MVAHTEEPYHIGGTLAHGVRPRENNDSPGNAVARGISVAALIGLICLWEGAQCRASLTIGRDYL
jgi:hypothetical protein